MEHTESNANESSSRFSNQLFFTFSSQDVLNIIESLTVYRDLILPKRFRGVVTEQLKKITNQLELQGIKSYAAEDSTNFHIGDYCLINDSQYNKGIILGAADEDELFKVAVVKDNDLDIIEIPMVLLSKL